MNVDHFKKLLQGVEAWNVWREENPEIKPNLNNAELCKVPLAYADLRYANLRYADLSSAMLYKTLLRGADLRNVDLEDANLEEADLRGADLRGAILNGVKWDEANLDRALMTSKGGRDFRINYESIEADDPDSVTTAIGAKPNIRKPRPEEGCFFA
jgi:uncharacterized protein YjbI with pentapeptide repeats